MSEMTYKSSALPEEADSFDKLNVLLYSDESPDNPVESAKNETEGVNYEDVGDVENDFVEAYWVDGDAGVAAVLTQEGETAEYWVVGATEDQMIVATDDTYQRIRRDREQNKLAVEEVVDAETGKPSDKEEINYTVLADMYEIMTDWEEYQASRDTTTSVNMAGDWEKKEAVYSDVIDLLEEKGELEMDDGWKNEHVGKARGDQIAVEAKKIIERLDKPYDVVLDSTGQNATLRIQDYEEQADNH